MKKQIVYSISVSTPFGYMNTRRVQIDVQGVELDVVLARAKQQLIKYAGKIIDLPSFTNPNIVLSEKIMNLDNWSEEIDKDMTAWHAKHPKSIGEFTILTERFLDDGDICYGLKKCEIGGKLLARREAYEQDPNWKSPICPPSTAKINITPNLHTFRALLWNLY